MQELPLPSGFKKKYGENVFNGLPYKGIPMDRKESDPDYRQPVMCTDVYIKIFILNKEEDLKEWQDVMQRVSDLVASVSFEDKQYDKELQTWRVLLRWMEHYYTNPEGDPLNEQPLQD